MSVFYSWRGSNPSLILTMSLLLTFSVSLDSILCDAYISSRPFASNGQLCISHTRRGCKRTSKNLYESVGFRGSFRPTSPGITKPALLRLSKDDENTIKVNSASVELIDEVIETENSIIDSESTQEASVDEININAVCRIVASADGKIPASLHTSMVQTADKVDAIYSAINNQHLNSLSIMNDIQNNVTTIQTLTESLQNSGFIPLSQRDLDLCAALNPGYLLRLSIAPDLNKLDPDVYHEFYPSSNSSTLPSGASNGIDNPKSLFGGRVLIFRRGYSEEITTGRLLLPKLDYLQSSLVQRSASKLARRISDFDSSLSSKITNSSQSLQMNIQSTLDDWKDKIKDPNEDDVDESSKDGVATDASARVTTGKKISKTASRIVKQPLKKGVDMLKNATSATGNSLNASLVEKKMIKLERYTSAGTGSIDSESNTRFSYPGIDEALDPFLMCEIDSEGVEIDAGMSSLEYSYTTNDGSDDQLPIRLLQRVSIANLVDFFSSGGRRRLIKSLFSVSELVEPTFEEIVVIWRPLSEVVKKKKVFVPPPVPKFIYDVLEVFGVENKLPQQPEPEKAPDPLPIQIRTFDRVPMANLLAVLPKTKLVFRPADALIFDLVNLFSLLAVLASQKFDSPKLDIIALVSVFVWVTRTFFRYSNKVARYDLLVNKFLTQKISHRDIGALKYIANEAAVQRARRATLVHDWLAENNGLIIENQLHVGDILEVGPFELNRGISIEHPVNIDIEAALEDLVDLGLIRFDEDGLLKEIKTGDRATEALADLWNEIFRVI